MSFFRTVYRTVLDFIVPPLCPICKKRVLLTHGLCSECFSKIHFICHPYCEICGKPFEFDIPEETRCGACCKKNPIFTKARSAFIYDSFSAKLILPFKHSDHLELAPLLTNLLYRAGADLLADTDLIIGVPLHRFRHIKRKYNHLFVWATVAVIFRELAVTGIRLLAVQGDGKVIAANMLGKIKTVTQILCICSVIIEPLIYAIPGLNAPAFMTTYMPISYVTTALMLVFTVWSGINYLKGGAKYIKTND